jgi:hypothetical protein
MGAAAMAQDELITPQQLFGALVPTIPASQIAECVKGQGRGGLRNCEQKGQTVQRVVNRPATFPAWCREKDR